MSSTHRYIDTPIRCNISFIGTNTMARLPYADLSHPDARPLVEQIVAERGSVLHLYQMLLHSPPIARGWLKNRKRRVEGKSVYVRYDLGGRRIIKKKKKRKK